MSRRIAEAEPSVPNTGDAALSETERTATFVSEPLRGHENPNAALGQFVSAVRRLDLARGITEHDVSAFLLEIPWSDQYRVAHLDPDPPLHLAPNPTYACNAVCAFYKDPVVA